MDHFTSTQMHDEDESKHAHRWDLTPAMLAADPLFPDPALRQELLAAYPSDKPFVNHLWKHAKYRLKNKWTVRYPSSDQWWERTRQRVKSMIVVNDEDCWVWTGHLKFGYGSLNLFGDPEHLARYTQQAHRVSYRAFVGPIGEGLSLDHLCRVKSCVNPAHLEPVTQQVNLRRGAGRGGALNPHSARSVA